MCYNSPSNSMKSQQERTFEKQLRDWYENPVADDETDSTDSGYDAICNKIFVVDGFSTAITTKEDRHFLGHINRSVKIEMGPLAAHCNGQGTKVRSKVRDIATYFFNQKQEESPDVGLRIYQSTETSLENFEAELLSQVNDEYNASTCRYSVRTAANACHKLTIVIQRHDCLMLPWGVASVYWAESGLTEQEKQDQKDILSEVTKVLDSHDYDLEPVLELCM